MRATPCLAASKRGRYARYGPSASTRRKLTNGAPRHLQHGFPWLWWGAGLCFDEGRKIQSSCVWVYQRVRRPTIPIMLRRRSSSRRFVLAAAEVLRMGGWLHVGTVREKVVQFRCTKRTLFPASLLHPFSDSSLHMQTRLP